MGSDCFSYDQQPVSFSNYTIKTNECTSQLQLLLLLPSFFQKNLGLTCIWAVAAIAAIVFLLLIKQETVIGNSIDYV